MVLRRLTKDKLGLIVLMNSCWTVHAVATLDDALIMYLVVVLTEEISKKRLKIHNSHPSLAVASAGEEPSCNLEDWGRKWD